MASTNIRLATVERRVYYNSSGPPPSFIQPVCTTIVEPSEVTVPDGVSTEEIEGPRIHVCFIGGE